MGNKGDEPLLRLHVFPADQGDCLWIEYGTRDDVHHILIDGGTDGTGKRLVRYIHEKHAGKCYFDLLVITHVDSDHIAGVLSLLQANDINLGFGDIWFNGYVHLRPETLEVFGGVQGERLTSILRERRLPWNSAFSGGAVRLTSDDRPLTAPLQAGATMEVISADEARLVRLERVWKKVCREAGLDPSCEPPPPVLPPGLEAFGGLLDVAQLAMLPFKEDSAEANGSSVGLVFSFEGKRLVLLGDAYPSVVLKGLKALAGSGPLRAEVVKVSHHGSRNNTNRELVEHIDSKNWVFSTSGAIFGHPDREAVARTICFSNEPTLWFNFRTEANRVWDDPGLKASKKHPYAVQYGDGTSPMTLEVL